MYLLTNIIAFKIAWTSIILGAANGWPLVGPVVVLLAIAIHLRNATDPNAELLLLVLTGVSGATWDSVMVSAGWLSYPNGNFIAGVAPYWIIAMWMLFATTLNITLRWLRGRKILAAILGALIGPLSYYLGQKIGAVVIHDLPTTMIALSISWAVLLPALSMLAGRLDGFQEPQPVRTRAD